MRWVAAVLPLLLSAGCASTRVVHIDVGNGQRVVHASVEVEPVEVSEDAFKSALTRLILAMRMDVAFQEVEEVDERGWARSKSLLASAEGIVDAGSGSSLETLYSRICPEAEDCLTLVGGTGLTFSRKDRTLMALSFALDSVWESVEAEVGKVLNPVALKALVTSAALTLLLTMALPEPVTKVIAVALTAAMVAYLGVVPVWAIGRGFVQLWDDAGTAMSVSELQAIGQRYGRVLGTNGTRVLVLVVMAALGGKSAMAAQGPKLPGFPQAALRAQAEAGFPLGAALNGGVTSIAMPAAGVLNVALAPGAAAALAMYSDGRYPGDDEGPTHHICTNKNTKSPNSGGPWTPLCEKLFGRAGLSLNDVSNLVRLRAHQGPHPQAYHQAVIDRLQKALGRCKSEETCRPRLVEELAKIADELMTPGSDLRRLVVAGER